MSKINKFFKLAKKIAKTGDSKEAKRRYRLGAIGLRNDGVIVCSSNICTRKPHPRAHAEARISNKLTKYSIVYVVRIGYNNQLLPAKPCKSCLAILKNKHISKIYYSISDTEYGIIYF